MSNESGRQEVYVRPFESGGETVRVSTEGGSQVRWHPNGRDLSFVPPDARLMAAPITEDRASLNRAAGLGPRSGS